MLLCDAIVSAIASVFLFVFCGIAYQFSFRCENSRHGFPAFLDVTWANARRFFRRCRACWEALDVLSNLFLLFPEESKANIETRVSELIDRRLACLPCPSRCEARTFRLLQCSRTTTVLQGDRRLCSQHNKGWHKPGLVGQDLTVSHRSSLSKHFIKCFTNPVFDWFSRDLFWDELEKFGCDNISDAQKKSFWIVWLP